MTLFDVIDDWVSRKLDCGEDINDIISQLNDMQEDIESFYSVEQRFDFIKDLESIKDNLLEVTKNV